MTIVKVSSKSHPGAVAGAIAGIVRTGRPAETQAVGAGAVHQAIKSVIYARRYLAEDGIDVIFLLAPYHPGAYQLIRASEVYACVGETETYYRAYAARHGLTVYGSYNPSACGVTADDFYDAVHSRPETLRRLFDAGHESPNAGADKPTNSEHMLSADRN